MISRNDGNSGKFRFMMYDFNGFAYILTTVIVIQIIYFLLLHYCQPTFPLNIKEQFDVVICIPLNLKQRYKSRFHPV